MLGAEVEKAVGKPILGRFHGFYSLGAGMGAAIGAASISFGVSTAVHLVGFGLITGALVLMFAQSDWHSVTRETTQKTPMVAWPRGPLLLVGIAAFASSIGEGSVFDWGVSRVILCQSLWANSKTNAPVIRAKPTR